MMRNYTTVFLLAFSVAATAQTTHELTNNGNTFDPPVINMIAGDSIHLVLGNPHTCTEVDQATWNANDNTSNGGFNYPAGEHTFALETAGTYYYVCIPHAGQGMKGQFIVDINTGVAEEAPNTVLQLFPNPARTRVALSGVAPGEQVQVFNMNGKLVIETAASTDGMLNVSTLDVGTYMVAVRNEQGERTAQTRLVVSR